MAFPSSPIEGQIYKNKYYSVASNSWNDLQVSTDGTFTSPSNELMATTQAVQTFVSGKTSFSVGQVYTQYTGTPTPASIFGGTWADISASISQSAKGGVYASGTNANGSWIQWADGTMYCWFQSPVSLTINTAYGGIFYSSQTTFTFPQPFLSGNIPVVTLNASKGTLSGFEWGSQIVATTTTNFQFSLLGATASDNAFPEYTAIGKWSATPVSPSTFWQCTNTGGTAGTPTLIQSAIYASGNNSNGYYVQYTDGTMIQWGGGLNSAGNPTVVLNFPQSFIDVSYRASFTVTRPAVATVLGGMVTSKSNNYCLVCLTYVVNSGITGFTGDSFDWQVIGKWSSQTVPAPAGGIVAAGIFDSGTNSNGSWIRYVDGTMECWGRNSSLVNGSPGQYPSLLYYKSVTVTFPQPFISLPTVTSAIEANGNDGMGGNVGSVTNISVVVTGYAGVAGAFIVSWRAIGKWSTGVQISPNTYSIVAPGTLVQVITASSGFVNQTISSTTPVLITGMSCTIVPKYPNSLILIEAQVSASWTYVSSVHIYKNGADLILNHGDNNQSGGSNALTTRFLAVESTDGNNVTQLPVMYQDTPGVTTAVTYDIRANAGWSGAVSTLYINNRAGLDMLGCSFMKISEIKQ